MRTRVVHVACLACLAACGSRSGLLDPNPPGVDKTVPDNAPDSMSSAALPLDAAAIPNESDGPSSERRDATADAPDESLVQPTDVIDAQVDVSAFDAVSERVATGDEAVDGTELDVAFVDVARDAQAAVDVSVVDAVVDVANEADADAVADAPEDVLPGIDVRAPGNDPSCEGGATRIFVISESEDLLSFHPATSSFTKVGTIKCPGTTSYPNSMAVARSGMAYVGFVDGSLYRVRTTTASCQATSFVVDQDGFSEFGMGYVRNDLPDGETLFVASQEEFSRLAWIDTSSFALHVIGPLTPTVTTPELTGTGAGQLFAFEAIDTSDSAILEIDKTTATVVAESVLSGVERGNAWAFAYWGEAFYTFTRPATSPGSVVTRFRPSDGSITRVASTTEVIVGAGVSTCAP